MRYILRIFCTLCVLSFVSCDDFFNTSPKNIINSSDYISQNDEAYKGFMGILTRMQNAGDHAIFLTDTRGDFMEITPNAPIALQNIYNYAETDGNEYANPTCYYSVIISCNDFIDKVRQYKEKSGASLDEKTLTNYNALISSALRIKVWAYYTLGRIYGKAVWFDSPLENLADLNDTKKFTWLNDMPSIVSACLNLLDNGIQQSGKNISANLDMDWVGYLDAETHNDVQYEYWKYLTPNYMLLRCELLSWRGNQDDWMWIRDNILAYLDVQHKTVSDYKFSCCIPLTDIYYQMFYTERIGNNLQLVSSIMYDYSNNQKNRLVQYFCPDYPGGGYYLRPSIHGIGKYPEGDVRSLTQRLVMTTINGQTSFSKYFYFRGTYLRSKIFEIQPSVVLQRGHDYHFLLAEAENHLGNWRQTQCILNQGITNEFPYVTSVPSSWNTYYASWFAPSGGYGDIGIVGCVRGRNHVISKPTDAGYSLTESERMKQYDLALLDEYLLEYTGEGKSYSYMIKMAQRYGDPSIVADRVCPKYPVEKQAAIRSAIEAGGYWVNWNLNGDTK
jgi:starch-binding outer membrane protein, SusD/RagB family